MDRPRRVSRRVVAIATSLSVPTRRLILHRPAGTAPRSRVGEDLTPRFRARVRRTDTAQSVRQEPLVHALADPRRAHEIVRPRPDSGEAQRPRPPGPTSEERPRVCRVPPEAEETRKNAGANFGASSAIFLAGHFEGTRGAPAAFSKRDRDARCDVQRDGDARAGVGEPPPPLYSRGRRSGRETRVPPPSPPRGPDVGRRLGDDGGGVSRADADRGGVRRRAVRRAPRRPPRGVQRDVHGARHGGHVLEPGRGTIGVSLLRSGGGTAYGAD